MKKSSIIPALLFSIIFFVIFFSCRKAEKINALDKVQSSSLKISSCKPPDYGDSILYHMWMGPGNDYKVQPRNNRFPGTWFAFPEGLIINSTTGEINVSASESGMRYQVGFVKSGTQDTCISTLILAGITYVDSVYDMSKNDTLAYPYYNASPNAPAVCDLSDDTDYPNPNGGGSHGNNKCEFDDDDDDDLNNGPFDEPPAGSGANKQGVYVRTVSGIINLKRTMADLFGNNPQNGDTKNVDIYYRLNDRSGKALQRITVRFVYYNTEADIPIYLRNEIRAKRNSFYSYSYDYYSPRPPMIILTSYTE